MPKRPLLLALPALFLAASVFAGNDKPEKRTCLNGLPAQGPNCTDLTVSGLTGTQDPKTTNVALSWNVTAVPDGSCENALKRDATAIPSMGSPTTDSNVLVGPHMYKLSVTCTAGLGNDKIIHKSPEVGKQVIVVPPCSKPPAVTLSINPPTIMKKPKGSTTIALTGTVAQDAGCKTSKAGYSVRDEFGRGNPTGPVGIVPGSNSFTASVTLPIDLKAHEKEKDGRTFDVTVTVANQLGEGSAAAVFRVRHDKKH